MRFDARGLRYFILVAVVTIAPFLIAFLLVNMSGNNLFSIVPYYEGGDETARYSYVASILEYGQVLGYNGYDGGTAVIANMGNPWGIGWTLPYLLFGLIFGWGLNSPILANIFFLCLANLLFIMLTKCNEKTVFYIGAINCVLFINIYYSITAMSECSRYAVTIIIIAMLYRLFFYKTSQWFKYIVIPLLLIIASAMYIILSAFIFLYCIIMFKDKKKRYSVVISVVIFLITTMAIKKINSLFGTPYYQQGTIGKILSAFSDGTVDGVKTTFGIFINNLSSFDIFSAISNIEWSYGRFTWFVFLCWIITGYLSYIIIKKKLESKRDRAIAISALYLLVIFIMGHLVLYNDVMPTLIRGINTAVCGVAFMSTLMESKQLANIFIICSLLWGAQFLMNINACCDKEYKCYSESEIEKLVEKQELISSYIDLSPENDPWENTIATYCAGGSNALALPTGAGRNSMSTIDVNKKAKYVFIGNGGDEERIDEKIQLQLSNNHVILVQTDEFTLLQNTK